MSCANPKRPRFSREVRAKPIAMKNNAIYSPPRKRPSPAARLSEGSRFSLKNFRYIMHLRLMPYLPA